MYQPCLGEPQMPERSRQPIPSSIANACRTMYLGAMASLGTAGRFLRGSRECR